MRLIWALVPLGTSMTVSASDIREWVGEEPSSDLVSVIDPGVSIFGIPFGTSEDTFINEHGKPTGYIRISRSETAMLFGTKHLFVFEDNKLDGVRISRHVLDWKISQHILANTEFDRVRSRLSNGIQEGMDRSEIKRILGAQLVTGSFGYQHHYFDQGSRVELNFSDHVDAGDEDTAYTLHAIYIRRMDTKRGRSIQTPALPGGI